jgi:hypothetical protein
LISKKKQLAIVVEFGFHDLKKYVHSGLAVAHSKEYDVTWMVLDKGNASFHAILEKTGFAIEYIQSDQLISIASKMEAYNQAIRRSWMVNKDLGIFHNYQVIRQKNWKTKILGNSLFKSISEKLTLAVCKKYYNPTLAKRLEELKLDRILLTGYASLLTKNIVVTAANLDINTFSIVNSWKDLYVNNFIPSKSFSKLFVWDEQMKKDFLLQAPYLDAKKIVPTGNPTFDFLIGSKPKFDSHFYASKYKISSESKWLYYTMMPPGVVDNEIETILFIAREMYTTFQMDYTILIRRNPNHSSSEFSERTLPPNVVLTEHYCEFDKEQDMLVQSPEGEQEWLDLLHHTCANLSVPSTVTKEFMMLGKPVFNIAFNENNELNPHLNQFFEAGFYRDLFDREKVFSIETIDELFTILKTQSILEHQLAPVEKKAVNRILTEIESE